MICDLQGRKDGCGGEEKRPAGYSEGYRDNVAGRCGCAAVVIGSQELGIR